MEHTTQKQPTSLKLKILKILNWLGPLIIACLFIRYWIDNPTLFYGQVQFIVFIFLITIFTRSVSVHYGFMMYARGLCLGVGITLFIGMIYRTIGFDPGGSLFAYAFFFPIVEEVFKLFPVFLSAYLLYQHNPEQKWNISDWLMLGMMSGTAFGMSEDFYRTGYFGEHYGPHIENIFLFPDATGASYDRFSEIIGYIGHGAGTAFIAIAIGFGLYFAKKFHKKNLHWQIPLAAFAWITFEHMANNAGNDSTILLKIFTFLGGGKLTPWLFLFLILGGIGIDAHNFMHAYKKLPKFKKTALFGAEKIKNFVMKKTWPPLSFVKGYFNALRFLNQAAWTYFFKS